VGGTKYNTVQFEQERNAKTKRKIRRRDTVRDAVGKKKEERNSSRTTFYFECDRLPPALVYTVQYSIIFRSTPGLTLHVGFCGRRSPGDATLRFPFGRVPAEHRVPTTAATRAEARDGHDSLGLVDGAGGAAELAKETGVFVGGHLRGGR
jgi:hypothetical protein